MADAVTLPSDIFRPEVCRDLFGYELSDSLQLLDGAVGTGADSPVQVIGLGNIQGRASTVQQPVLKEISNLVTSRDITSISDIDTLKLDGRNDIGVIKHLKVGPVAYTPDAAFLTKASAEAIMAEFARQAANKVRVAMQSSITNALYGIISGMTASVHTLDVWATDSRTNFGPSLMTQGLQKMAEFDDRITFMLMRSEALQDLRDDNIGRAYAGVGDVVLKGGSPMTLGRRYGVVNESILTASDAGFNKYRTLFLGPGVLRVEFSRPPVMYPPVMFVDKDTVQIQLRMDLDYTILPVGASWGGGANPADSDLATPGNWTPTYSSHKEVHGVYLQHNYSGN